MSSFGLGSVADPLEDFGVTSSGEVQLEGANFQDFMPSTDRALDSAKFRSDTLISDPSIRPWNDDTSRIISLIGINALQQ